MVQTLTKNLKMKGEKMKHFTWTDGSENENVINDVYDWVESEMYSIDFDRHFLRGDDGMPFFDSPEIDCELHIACRRFPIESPFDALDPYLEPKDICRDLQISFQNLPVIDPPEGLLGGIYAVAGFQVNQDYGADLDATPYLSIVVTISFDWK